MTLQIQNIRYDHSQETRIYEPYVVSIDTQTKRIHIHDGITPNGIEQPVMADLSQFANRSLSNVTQEDMSNILTNYGAVNMNTSSPITTAQKDNLYGKLYMTPLQSTANLPASNFLSINSTTRQIGTRNTSEVPTFFPSIDTSQTSYTRANNVQYTASRHCMVIVKWNGHNASNIVHLLVDGVEIWGVDMHVADRSVNTTATDSHVIAAGSTYQVTGVGVISIVEYGIKKLSF